MNLSILCTLDVVVQFATLFCFLSFFGYYDEVHSLHCILFLDTDFSTDGKWCYIVLWVVPRPSSLAIDWQSLKSRIISACPSFMISFYLNQQSTSSRPSPLYLLKMFSLDRKGLLHGKFECPVHSSFPLSLLLVVIDKLDISC